MALDQIYITDTTCWSGYRLDVDSVGTEVSDIAMFWLHNNDRLESLGFMSEASITVPNVYDIPSILTAFFGRSSFGYKARQYADYLYRNCRQSPPDALRPHNGPFSGAICSYLPIALYQAALGIHGSEIYMAIDARRSLPKALVTYFDSNSYWQNYDIPY
ncbi:hypothetical protein GCM10023116_00680 [Kistimonas scapharcae]|uniref:Uncharacterized protein n=1 Tax=Kistimonas scapharcae TaxID=1036133 RepID=A0ABP8UW73_9GAMM